MIKRRKNWDKSGVSEVIGTILTLAITVVLFSSMLFLVNRIPAPGENTYVSFSGRVEPINAWADGAWILVTNDGGVIMTEVFTSLYIVVDSDNYILDTVGLHNGVPYGLYQYPDGDWEAGETWKFRLDAGNITPMSEVSVAIVDLQKDTLVWSSVIYGSEQQLAPVIIDAWIDTDDSTERRDPIEFNRYFHFYAKIGDPNDDLDDNSVIVDMSDIGLGSAISMNATGDDGMFHVMEHMGERISVGYYFFIVYASDDAGHSVSKTVEVAVGYEIGDEPNLVVREDKISFSVDNPKHGTVLTIYATVRNLGKSYCWVDVFFYDESMELDPIGHDQMLIAGVDSQTAFTYWRASPGGEHTIYVEAVVNDDRDPYKLDFDESDNWNSTSLSVLPTILLVDDDNYPNDRSGADTVGFMRSALASCSFTYDYVRVGMNSPGPGYDYGDYRLQNYDIAIWMTGYENTSTLTSVDQDNLEKFLTNTSNNRNNTGSLWLIGSSWLEDPNLNNPGNTFKEDFLHIDTNKSIPNATALVRGVAGHTVSDEWVSDPFEVMERVAGEIEISNITEISDTYPDSITKRMLMTGSECVSISHENTTLDERIVVFPWEFSRIKEPSIQTQMAFKVILWLGNITKIMGQDVAISSQLISPVNVFYQETVNISAVIRNNGVDDLYNVIAVLYIDGVRWTDSTMVSGTIAGKGGSWHVWYEWVANEIGTHILKWKADPDNVIIETNEMNNEVSDYLSTGELTVQFRVLVVDDDESLNNGGPFPDDQTVIVTDALDRLAYTYETHIVPLNQLGPAKEKLMNYSAVLWVTGNSSDASAILPQDKDNIRDFFSNQSGRLWLVGANCLGNVIDVNFDRLYLKIESLQVSQQMPAIMTGVRDDPITHGMEIQTLGGNEADYITPNTTVGASGILQNGSGDFVSVKYDSGTYQSVVSTFALTMLEGDVPGYISGKNARDELIFMILRWLEKPEGRIELRITNIDFEISDSNPILGNAYVLRATVHNVGGTDANALVRFTDGQTQIGSDTVSVSSGDSTTAEVIWRPLFAGDRTITINVDPADIDDVDEIFEYFNNNISTNIYVYFFWDDMENINQSYIKWSHYSTVVNINGENPIDYFTSPANLDTDIISEWNETESYGITNVTDSYHTLPTSYHMEEPQGVFGGKADVLLSIVIDNSDSMTDRVNGTGASWLEVGQLAALSLVDSLTDDSAVSVYAFGGNNVVTVIGMTQLTVAGRINVNNAIDGITQGQMTLVWDAIGSAYTDVKANVPAYPDLSPAVVVLSDGADYQSNDASALPNANKLEAASSEWAPWHEMQPELGYPQVNYPAGSHKGKYANPYTEYGPGGSISPVGRWVYAGGGSYEPLRKGLLTSDVPIYTVGLALEHHEPVWAPSTAIEPVPDWLEDDPNALWTGGTESGTMEYNLWRIANTSKAEYFYSTDADELVEIFNTIGGIIGVSGFNQTRGTRAPAVGPNSDKRAVTETFSLEGIDNAKLSFWHKYNIIQGGNGAFLQVAYKLSAGGDWIYKYIIPPGQYTGGLYFPENVYDDLGTLIKWCWNGVSGRGSFNWDYVSFDISPFVPEGDDGFGHVYRSEVRIAFNYTQFGGGSGYGWWLDDVKLVVTRKNSVAVDGSHRDVWELTNMTALGLTAYNGNNCWWSRDVTSPGNHTMPGIDNALMTMPIDLTMAKNVYLSAYLKFNINTDDGMPPDGFRIEISSNGGQTWSPIVQAARSAMGVSGTGSDIDDGEMDGKAYTGLPPSGQTAADVDYWVEVGTLSRINVDLSNWRGKQVYIRFRMVTNNHPAYDHYDDPAQFGGFFVDNVVLKGETIHG